MSDEMDSANRYMPPHASDRTRPQNTPKNTIIHNKDPNVVQIDAVVLLKIAKHCRDYYPSPVSGQLLGLDVNNRLEVTNCFPLHSESATLNKRHYKFQQDQRELDEKMQEELDRYQLRMTDLMHEVNVDSFGVGWYQTMSRSDLRDPEIVKSLLVYQESIDKAVAIGFDPLMNAIGKMPFKAYRVSEEFIKAYREDVERRDPTTYNRLRSQNILLEVPLVINNSVLVESFLLDWMMKDSQREILEFNSLQPDQARYTDRSLIFLAESLEELSMEQERLLKFQKENYKLQLQQKQFLEERKLENDQRRLRGEALLPATPTDHPLFRRTEPPSQLPTLLMSNQVGSLTSELKNVAFENLAKTFLSSRATKDSL